MDFFITKRKKLMLCEIDDISVNNSSININIDDSISSNLVGKFVTLRYLNIKLPTLLQHTIDSYKYDFFSQYRCLYSSTVCSRSEQLQYEIPISPFIILPLDDKHPQHSFITSPFKKLDIDSRYFMICHIWYKSVKTNEIVPKVYSQFYTLDVNGDCLDNGIDNESDSEFVNITKYMTNSDIESSTKNSFLENSLTKEYWNLTVGQI